MAEISKIQPFGSTTQYDINAYKLRFLGAHSEVASNTDTSVWTKGNGTIGGDTTGLYFTATYNDSTTPVSYGNILTLTGGGSGQILAEWKGGNPTEEAHLYYRGQRDCAGSGDWRPWKKVAFIDDNVASATKISSTPNNTTTFLRGDNTWSNTLTGTLTTGPITVTKQDNANEGGEIQLAASTNGGLAAALDVYQKSFRIYSGSNVRFNLNLETGAISQATLPWGNITGKPNLLTTDSIIPIDKGGTGQTTKETARYNGLSLYKYTSYADQYQYNFSSNVTWTDLNVIKYAKCRINVTWTGNAHLFKIVPSYNNSNGTLYLSVDGDFSGKEYLYNATQYVGCKVLGFKIERDTQANGYYLILKFKFAAVTETPAVATGNVTIYSPYSFVEELNLYDGSSETDWITITAKSIGTNKVISNKIILQENNQWLSPARLQLLRPDTTIYTDRSCIGTTNGNLHLDAYKGSGIYLNHYSSAGNIYFNGSTYYINGGNYNGNAATATKLTSSAGSDTQPIYFSDGKPKVCTYALNKTVPSDAKFTDTTYPITFKSGSYGETGWLQLGGKEANASLIRVWKPYDLVDWGTIAHSAVISYGNGDTKGMIDISYNTPLISIAGGNNGGSTDAAPKWYFKLSATSGKTYTFPGDSKTLAASDGSNASGTWAISITGNASTATNADKVDNYHAADLWRKDGGIWNPGANITLGATANSQEWSFDITRNGYTGTMWHVWDSEKHSMLQVTPDDGKVKAPYGFVGNLTGNAATATKLTSSAGSIDQPVYFSDGIPTLVTKPLKPIKYQFVNGYANNTWIKLFSLSYNSYNIVEVDFVTYHGYDGNHRHKIRFRFTPNGFLADNADSYILTYEGIVPNQLVVTKDNDTTASVWIKGLGVASRWGYEILNVSDESRIFYDGSNFTDRWTFPTTFESTTEAPTNAITRVKRFVYASEAISNITRSGTTFTATRADGTTFTFTQQDNNSLTGVKGNAETNYRTGNVNLTPANILGTGTTGQFWRGDNTWSNTLTQPVYINNSTDVAMASQGSGALIIGNKTGTNIGIDDNEIMARNNTSTSTLYLNAEGGLVSCGGEVTATQFNGPLNGNANSTTLLKAMSATTTASTSTWNIPSGCKQVWGEKFSDSTLTYTPSGGSATTITDTGDWTMWLAPSTTSNTATLNMRIDGTYYGNFSGNLSGNASTATKLQTARTINGTSFDGSTNITTTNWGTARNISISDNDSTNTGTAVSVNGSAAVTLKLPAMIKATLKGNADTATKLNSKGRNNDLLIPSADAGTSGAGGLVPETGLTMYEYYAAQSTGAPTNYGNLITIKGNTPGATQIAFPWGGNNNYGPYIRTHSDWSTEHVWSPWNQLAFTTSNVASATKLASTPNNTTTFLRGDNTWSNTLTGQLYINYEQDVGLNQNGSLIIGNKSGTNIAIDSNEIMARNNSATSPLYIQNEGGETVFGGHINPNGNQNKNLGTSTNIWNNIAARATAIRHIDAGYANQHNDSALYIGYGSIAPTKLIKMYYSADTSSRTEFFQINNNGAYALTRFGVNGQNTSYNLYINGTSYHNGNDTHAGNILPEANKTRDLGASSYQWNNVYSKILVNNIQKHEAYTISSPDGAAYWVFLGTLVSMGNASVTTIDMYTGNGYNAQSSQNTQVTIFIKDGWQSANAAASSFGISYLIKYSADHYSNIQVMCRATAYNTLNVYVYVPWRHTGHYTIDGYYSSWTHDGSCLTEEPTDGEIQQVTLGDLMATNFHGALNGNAATATKLQTARTISLTGSVTGSASFDGSGNISISTSTNHNHDDRYVNVTGDTMTGQLNCNNHLMVYTATSGNAYNNGGSAIQVREVGGVGSAQSSWAYAPKIGFHWSGRVACQLGLDSSQYLTLYSNNSTNGGYFRAGELFTTNANGLRLAGGSGTTKSILLRNDGGNFWILCCNSVNAGDNWITPTCGGHPFHINLESGICYTTKLYGAVWNDYAEFRKDNLKEIQEPGRCVREVGDGTLTLTTKRLERGCEIISDTFGFAIGQDEENGYNTPIASNGRVLAYPYESIEEFSAHIGWPVCSGPNGTVSIMTEEEEEKYPSRIIGTISEIPIYEVWGTGNVQVNGRIWIRIK